MIVERAAFAALDASEGDYEELEDDFMLIANEGKLAIEVVEDGDEADPKQGILKKPAEFDVNEADYRSRDIKIITGNPEFEDEEEKALKEQRLAILAMLPEAG